MNILYEDKDILVVEKPAGIPVETSRIGSKDMVSLLKNHLAETGGKPGGIPYLGMIHRLDQPVQGVMVFAKNQKAAASLSKEIAQNEMKKTYLAVVEGTAKEEESLTDYLLKDGRTNTSKKVPKGTKGAKESRLSYECLKTLEDPALAALPALPRPDSSFHRPPSPDPRPDGRRRPPPLRRPEIQSRFQRVHSGPLCLRAHLSTSGNWKKHDLFL